jgi:hypothetical protein
MERQMHKQTDVPTDKWADKKTYRRLEKQTMDIQTIKTDREIIDGKWDVWADKVVLKLRVVEVYFRLDSEDTRRLMSQKKYNFSISQSVFVTKKISFIKMIFFLEFCPKIKSISLA